MPRLAASISLVVIAALAVACADGTKRMRALPSETGAQGKKEARGAVVLFRVSVERDGKPEQATLSIAQRWKWHLLVNVGSQGRALDIGNAFAAGQLDPAPRDAGWGFVTLPPGKYHLAFAAYRTRFALPGAQLTTLGKGQTGASQLEIPPDTTLLYIGTFDFTCHNVNRSLAYVDYECNTLQVRDEEELARQVASTSLSRFEPMRTAIASTPGAEPSR
jgi:hypothetical protein